MVTNLQHQAKWVAACALVVVLAAMSCSPQVEPTNSAGPSSQTPQPSRPADSPTATPSPTLQPPSPEPTLRPGSGQALRQGSGQASQVGSAALGPGQAEQTATPVPSPSPTPVPTLHQLTTGGCCTQPFWSPDSQQVLFIDKPAPDAPVGIWGVDVAQPDPTPELVTERIAFYTADMAFLVELGEDTTTIERLADNARWTVPADGRSVSISPGRTRIAWQASDEDLPFERQVTQVWVANLDGTDAQAVATLPRGGLSGWISDDVLLLSGRESLESREQVLYTFSLTSGHQTELVRAEQLRGGLLSPDGAWLAYYVALDEDPAQNGLWLVRTDGSTELAEVGSERRQLDRDLFGAYQWRDAGRLLIIPFRPEAVSHELWELDVNTGETRHLTDPDVTPFKIANGDWAVSPDGRHVTFVESRDRNIWLLTLSD
jgi:Tol biopolymer transport system component